MWEPLRSDRGSNRTFYSTARFCGEAFSVCVPLAVQRAGIVFQSHQGRFQRVCIAHIQPCALVGHCQHLSVTHGGFFANSPCRNVVLSRVQFLRSASGTRSARTYVPPTLSVQHDSLPQRVAPQAPGCYRCPSPQEARRATRVRSGFRSHEGGPVGRSTCRPSKTMFAGSNNRRQNHEASGIQSSSSRFVGRARNQYQSSAIINLCIFEPRGSRRACTWIGATHVFFPHVSIGRPAPTSENEPHLALKCAPKAAAAIAHHPFLPQCGTPVPSGTLANHRTIVATRGDGGSPSLMTAIDVGLYNCSMKTSPDADPASCQCRNGL